MMVQLIRYLVGCWTMVTLRNTVTYMLVGSSPVVCSHLVSWVLSNSLCILYHWCDCWKKQVILLNIVSISYVYYAGPDCYSTITAI